MYEELINSLRICGDWTSQVRLVGRDCCDGCKYQKDGVCESFKGNKELLLIEAADAIEELQSSKCPHYIHNEHDRGDDSLCDKWVCEVKAFPRWIPVTERLPEFDKIVLVSNGHDVDTGWAVEFTERDGEKKVAWASPFADFDDVNSITHWMPLPEPPKEETE